MASRNVVSPIGRVAYPALTTARRINEKSKPRYSVTLVFDKSVDLTAFKDVVRAVVKEKFPDGVPQGFRNPFRSGAVKRRPDGTYPEGFGPEDTFVEFWRYEEHGKAPCVGPDRNDLMPNDIYAGMTGRVSAHPFCYNNSGNCGVSLSLEAFQKAGDGNPIGAAPVDPKTEFDDVAGGTNNVSVAPAAAPAEQAVADDIPF